MMDHRPYDVAVIGGGIMGCATALRMNAGGMRAIVLDLGDLGQGASGVNAGTLSLQNKRANMMSYVLRGHRQWVAMGDDVGFRQLGGYTLAFNDDEAALMEEHMKLRQAAGAPIQFVSSKYLRSAEATLSRNVVAASYCSADGYANASLTGQYYRKRLKAENVDYREHTPLTGVSRNENGFCLETPAGELRAKRLLLAAGASLGPVASLLGVDLPVNVRINTVSVTERMPALFGCVIGHATGRLTMKQKGDGTILIGGGWQGRGTPQKGRGEVTADTLRSNLRLAQHAVPDVRRARVLRSWTGFEASVSDHYPLAGALPGVADAFVLGCVGGGYTIGPYIGQLMGDFILGREPELPLFDPARFI